MAVSCMCNVSGHNYRNSSFIVDFAMGQIPRSTERISSSLHNQKPDLVIVYNSVCFNLGLTDLWRCN